MKKKIYLFSLLPIFFFFFITSCSSESLDWETTQSIETMKEFDYYQNDIDYWKQVRFDVFNGSIPKNPFCNYYLDWLKTVEEQNRLFTSLWQLCFDDHYQYHDWLSDSFDG